MRPRHLRWAEWGKPMRSTMPSPPSGKRWPKYWSALRNSRSASTCPGVRAGESRGGSDGGGADGLVLAGGAGAGALSAAVSGKEVLP